MSTAFVSAICIPQKCHETYSKAIEPVPTSELPSKIGVVPDVAPPDVVRLLGRPKVNRIGKNGSWKRERGILIQVNLM